MRNAPARITTLVACAALAAGLAGCAQGEAEAEDDASLGDVVERFDSMTSIPGEPQGDTVVEAQQAGTLWLLTRRDEVGAASPADCSIDGAGLDDPSEDLNTPEPDDLGAPGDPQTMFAFAEAPIDEAGEVILSCDLEVDALLLLFEPEG
ncbi:hypothetical protein [Gulosibacter sp. 10]|uniref:hypothetical protein n=1 Tax=Gulosibacter sp. 10 TaxID=1255570 RepID=UPI00097F392A|nr:hypothetical protein [Gulosibacter sp. 10]SJM60683.1 hypothetical protein FM112_07335 [Gulosibacter sp. 10]